jgi:hypothetical protein
VCERAEMTLITLRGESFVRQISQRIEESALGVIDEDESGP